MNEKGIERFILILLTIHNIIMVVGAFYYKMSSWIPAVIIASAIVSVAVVYGSKWQFYARAVIVTILSCVSILVFGLQCGNIHVFTALFSAMTVIVAMYGFSKILRASVLTITLLIIYHIVKADYQVINGSLFFHYLLPLLEIYCIIMILYVWNVKRAESSEILTEMISDLKVLEHGKNDFIANVSHEIRTPVNNVVGMSELLLREDLSNEIRDKVISIQTSGSQLVSIVSDILDFSELQSGNMKLVESEYNIEHTFREIMSTVEMLKGEKNVQLLFNCDGTMPLKLVGDQRKLIRVITNLLDNAIKFTTEGCVVLTVGYRPEKYGINLIITVEDTGKGIEKENIEKLFTSYNQADSKRNRQTGGIGLGLAIIQSIVEIMGGVVSIYSEPEKGTTVRVVIPQKVSGTETLVKPIGNDSVSLLTYRAEESFNSIITREKYIDILRNMTKDLNISINLCHNLAELSRRGERDPKALMLTGFTEYTQNQAFFDELSNEKQIIVVTSKKDERYITNDKIIKILEPLYIGTFAEVIHPDSVVKESKFIAPNAKILIVDDNVINLNVISGLLAPYQMQITTSTSGADALEKVDKEQYDLIFLDHMMPEMDGIETLKRIRSKNGVYFKDVPVIALTANAVAGAREMFLEEGFQEFVAKPVNLNILDKILRDYIASAKLLEHEEEAEVTNKVILDIEDTSDRPTLGDLDIDQGISFCGSMENLLDVLKLHCNDGENNMRKIENYYWAKDWKNYSILVHGLKSSMKCVGANVLSDMAKELEFASKSRNETYIASHHSTMIAEYKRVLDILTAYFGISPTEEEEDVNGLTEVTEGQFTEFITELENASYSWDDRAIRRILHSIENCCYKGKSMAPLYDSLLSKIEMTDYLSACGLASKWKDNIDRKA